MSRYIDADELLRKLPDDLPYKASVKRVLMQAPTADVVEVVRCKDCQWWEPYTHGSTIGRCENPRNGLVNEYTDDNDYCSYGERSENGKS